MENNELDEMRAQLATLNEKLENESIVDEKHFSEATKKHLSELQRKLIVRIVICTILAPIVYWTLKFGLLILWCLGIVIISIYVYQMIRKGNSASMTVTEYAQRIRKTLKIYKNANKFMWIFSFLIIMLWGTIVLIGSWPSVGAFAAFFASLFMAFVLWVSYYISNVCVSPDVELMLKVVLEDLEKDKEKE